MRNPCDHRLLRLLTLLALLVLPQPALADAPVDFAKADPAKHVYDNWYLESINGQSAGYWHEAMAIKGKHIVSSYLSYSVEAHDGELMKSTSRVTWTETLDFKPVSIVVEDEAGGDTVTQTYRFTDTGIELTSEQDGRAKTTRLPKIDKPYLTAAQLSIAVEAHLKRGDKSFTVNILDPLVGMEPYAMAYKLADEPAKAFALPDGSKPKARRWVQTYSILPGIETDILVDDKLRAIGMSYVINGMTVTSRLADKSVTKLKFNPPEMAQLSVVKPDRAIKDVDKHKKIVYELVYNDQGQGIVPVNTTHQHVERVNKDKVRVTVDLKKMQDAKARQADRPTEAHLEASIKVDHKDKKVRELAAQAKDKAGKDADTHKLAMACKRFVSGYMTGATLSVGNATASEAARTKSGDCTENSVLLAAMLRAHGIPSRCVTGLVYSEDAFAGQEHVFVYHMWTQAWIEDKKDGGRWVDLDAAMWRYSAGHIALGVTDMGEKSRADDIKLIPMMQDLAIKVIETGK